MQQNTELGASAGAQPTAAISAGFIIANTNGIVSTTGDSASSAPLSELTLDDIRYRAEREEIVTRAINATVAAVKSSIEASKALFEIEGYNDGLLWKKDHRSFRDYCSKKWDYQKTYCYELLDTGGFITELEASHSAIAENFPINQGQVKPLLKLLKKERRPLRVECWNYIVADTAPAELTDRIVKAKTIEFLRCKGLDIRTSKRHALTSQLTPSARADAMGALESLKAALSNLPVPQRFEHLLSGIAALIGQDPEGAVVDVQAVTVEQPFPEIDLPASDSRLRSDTPETPCNKRKADAGHGPSRRRTIGGHHDQQPEPPLTRPSDPAQQVGNRDLQDRVAEAMTAAATNKVVPGVAPVEPDQEASRTVRDVSASPEQDCGAAAMPVSGVDLNDCMSLRLFLAVLHPGKNPEGWSNAIRISYQADIIVPHGGGDTRISLMRARSHAHLDNGENSTVAFKLVCNAQNSGESNPGAYADRLFAEHVQAAEAGTSIPVPWPARA